MHGIMDRLVLIRTSLKQINEISASDLVSNLKKSTLKRASKRACESPLPHDALLSQGDRIVAYKAALFDM